MSKSHSMKELLDTTHPDMFLGMVRMYLGLGLIVKAIYFMANQDYLLKLMEDAGNGWMAPAMMLHYIIPAHLLGGALLLVGLLTRVAALAQLPVLAGAVFWIYAPKFQVLEMRENAEFAVLVLFLLALVSVFGSGRWALDKKMFKATETSHTAAPASA